MAKIVGFDLDGSANALAGTSCAFGVFDGVHRGHRFLIECARKVGSAAGIPTAVLTFSIDPDELFAPRKLVKLMSNEGRIATLAALGVDIVAVIPFDWSFAALSPVEFLDSAFGQYPPFSMHVGEGFRFGSKGSGDVRVLVEWGEPLGMEVVEHELLGMDGAPISSTRIRNLLLSGRGSEAENLLGHGLSAYFADMHG